MDNNKSTSMFRDLLVKVNDDLLNQTYPNKTEITNSKFINNNQDSIMVDSEKSSVNNSENISNIDNSENISNIDNSLTDQTCIELIKYNLEMLINIVINNTSNDSFNSFNIWANESTSSLFPIIHNCINSYFYDYGADGISKLYSQLIFEHQNNATILQLLDNLFKIITECNTGKKLYYPLSRSKSDKITSNEYNMLKKSLQIRKSVSNIL
jgi:hypothetical protein